MNELKLQIFTSLQQDAMSTVKSAGSIASLLSTFGLGF